MINNFFHNRIKQGESVELFDKEGSFILCKVQKIDKNSSKLKIEDVSNTKEVENKVDITLAVGMPKVRSSVYHSFVLYFTLYSRVAEVIGLLKKQLNLA